MSDESPSISTPDLAGSTGHETAPEASDWDDEPSEPKEAPKAKAEPKEAPTPKPATPEAKKPNYRTVKINDKEELVDDDELIRTYSKSKAGEDKFREAAELKKQMDAFHEALRNDPISLLNDKRLPIQRKELAEKWLLEALEEEMQDPRDRELKTKEQELKAYKDKEAALKKAEDDKIHEGKRELKRQEISKLFSSALDKTPLSKDPATAQGAIRDMAMYMRIAKEQGIEVGADELAAHVNDRHYKSMHALANQLDGNDLINFLGKDVLAKIRKADLAAIKTREAPAPQQHKQEEKVSNPRSKAENIDPYAAREMVRQKLFGK